VFALQRGRWSEAHALVGLDGSPQAAWLYGNLHRQEGALEDAEYWYGNAGRSFRGHGTLEEELALFEAALQGEWPGLDGEAASDGSGATSSSAATARPPGFAL
jgi:hypothetical protein